MKVFTRHRRRQWSVATRMFSSTEGEDTPSTNCLAAIPAAMPAQTLQKTSTLFAFTVHAL